MPFDLHSPVTEANLATLDDRPEIIQFSSALSESDYALLGDWFDGQPSKTLRVYGSDDGTITDLEFLRHFPKLHSFQADALYHSLVNIDGLAHLPDDVQYIGLGQTKKRLPLAPLARFTKLQRLHLEGQSKDIEVVSHLRELKSVTLRSITLPDLALLKPLSHLRALDLKLGGTMNLALLPELQSLEYLELWMVKGLSDLSPIAELPRLEYLFLQALRQVESLPAMANLVGLQRLWLETMSPRDCSIDIEERPCWLRAEGNRQIGSCVGGIKPGGPGRRLHPVDHPGDAAIDPQQIAMAVVTMEKRRTVFRRLLGKQVERGLPCLRMPCPLGDHPLRLPGPGLIPPERLGRPDRVDRGEHLGHRGQRTTVDTVRGYPGQVRHQMSRYPGPGAVRVEPEACRSGHRPGGKHVLCRTLSLGEFGAVGAPWLIGHQAKHRTPAVCIRQHQHCRCHASRELHRVDDRGAENRFGPGQRLLVDLQSPDD